MSKKNQNPKSIRDEIERLKGELVEAERAEKARKLDELTRLVSRAGAIDEALAWARNRANRAPRPVVRNDQ